MDELFLELARIITFVIIVTIGPIAAMSFAVTFLQTIFHLQDAIFSQFMKLLVCLITIYCMRDLAITTINDVILLLARYSFQVSQA